MSVQVAVANAAAPTNVQARDRAAEASAAARMNAPAVAANAAALTSVQAKEQTAEANVAALMIVPEEVASVEAHTNVPAVAVNAEVHMSVPAAEESVVPLMSVQVHNQCTMNIVRPSLSPYVQKVERGSRIIYINPNIPRWVVTDACGDLVLSLFDGTSTIDEIIETAVSGLGEDQRARVTGFCDLVMNSGLMDHVPPGNTPKTHRYCLSSVHLSLSDSCNLNCAYCYARERVEKKHPKLTYEDYTKIIDDVLEISRGVTFTLTGGEPLLNPDCLRIAEYIKSKGAACYLLSNGLLIDENNIGKISALFDEFGSNVWFEKEAMELVPEGFTCPHCGGKTFDKETDTLDCWFDSGSTHFSSLMKDTPELWPADVYLEGADQYRGWFQSSLLTSVGALDQGAPFKQVLTHGWVVDGQGRAMHKSLGNGVDPADLIKDFGADIVRLWAASSDYHADVRCSKEIFKQIAQNYLKFRNTARYFLGNLADFDPNTDMVALADMEELDRWAMTKLDELTKLVRKSYNGYEFHVITHAMNDFCVVELSSFYLDILKDRLYCEDQKGLRRRSAQTALFLIVDAMAKVFSPILAFTCDEVWQMMPHLESDDARNVLLNQMPTDFSAYKLDEATMEKWSIVMKLRQDVNGVLERARKDGRIGKALEAHVALATEDTALKAACEGLNLAEICIVSSCDWAAAEEGAEVGNGVNFPELVIGVSEAKGEKCPRCWMHSLQANAEGLCPRCAAVISKLDIEL